MSLLETINLSKQYEQGLNIVKALNNINLKIEKGNFIAIVGTSGSGKSTLLHMLSGLDRPTSGQVFVNNKDISKFTEDALTIFRRRNIGFIFQNYNLIPMLSVCENILLPLQLDGNNIDTDFFNKIVTILKLKEKLSCLPNQLSGGQQQKVAIARALITKPTIILADEPTGNLDSKTSQEVLGLLKISSELFHQTIVMITHNEEIAQLANSIIRLEDGKIIN
ncbi:MULTISPECIES: ABC transporter ATP-binding protein [Clostridium]|uniref:ABC transporter ATP-binding protein n=1 Tax=Clostridium aquiflavi TaxID=3073603 RepID=A0ABU1EGF8_9CLOT|nr:MULTISPECIES: ABC transporter ATP-binding protein [unclassified Clostridium]MDR5587478.1 ABC transporter ATP-binding protein [Clostridium sp. 5N-1]NFG63408.1 ABC transporter ATP-binding protein [Clostridium botulinum]NFQ11106.1 ABC transporter ATP-binding protein [Clostridium botulinum]